MVDDRTPGQEERRTKVVTCACGRTVRTSVKTNCPGCGKPVG